MDKERERGLGHNACNRCSEFRRVSNGQGRSPLLETLPSTLHVLGHVQVAPSLGSCQGYSVRGEQVGPALRVVPSVVPSDVGYSMVKGVE